MKNVKKGSPVVETSALSYCNRVLSPVIWTPPTNSRRGGEPLVERVANSGDGLGPPIARRTLEGRKGRSSVTEAPAQDSDGEPPRSRDDHGREGARTLGEDGEAPDIRGGDFKKVKELSTARFNI